MSRILGSCTLRGVVQSLERALPGRLGKMRPIDLSSVPDEARRMHASSNFKYPLFSIALDVFLNQSTPTT